MREFPSIEAFYDDQPARRASREADYGVHWQAAGPPWQVTRWRVSYVQATGEVIAVEQSGPCRVQILGVVPPDPAGDDDVYYRTLDRILDGWAEIPSFDLAWVGQRLAAAAKASA